MRVNLLSTELDDNIQLVVARLRYGDNNRQFNFRRDDADPKLFRVASIRDPKTGKMLWPVEYSFVVYFNQAIGGVTSVSSDSLQTELNDVYLDIESVYGRYDFVIKAASQFDWSWYQSVLVTLRCRHIQRPNSSISKSYQISQTAQQDSYPVMLPDPDLYLFEVSKEYSTATNSPHIPAVLNEPTSRDVYLFSTLYRQRVLRLSASMDWQQVAMVIVSVSYAYSPTDSLQQVFQFTESDDAPSDSAPIKSTLNGSSSTRHLVHLPTGPRRGKTRVRSIRNPSRRYRYRQPQLRNRHVITQSKNRNHQKYYLLRR